MAFVALEKLHQLHDGYRKAINIAGKHLLLIQEDGQVRLIKNACPHANAPLTYATYGNGCLRCPVHGIEFDLKTGRSLSPACLNGLQFFSLIYEGNQIGIDPD